MNIYIRADSSVNLGSGHIMRCLTLADTLGKYGHTVSFICRNLPGNIGPIIQSAGHKLYFLPASLTWQEDAERTANLIQVLEKADWIIVDHYGLDYKWEVFLHSFAPYIMVIDDLANRRHMCDLLLDQNLQRDNSRYDNLVPKLCRKLLGLRYVLLREEFAEIRKATRIRDGKIKRIFVFFGGSDPTNETEKVLHAVQRLNKPDIAVDVVVGSANPYVDKVQHIANLLPNAKVYEQINNIASLMDSADLAIGAGGTTTWERCCVGVPSIIIAVADNQQYIAEQSANTGAAIYLGISNSVNVEGIEQAIRELFVDSDRMEQMGRKCMQLVDHEGAMRVSQIITNYKE